MARVVVPLILATTNPTTSHDRNSGYLPGMFWLNTSSPALYVCISNAASSADWDVVGGGGGGGDGTVTSVGLTLPSAIFDISGSPITTSGTLAVTLDVQDAGAVFAGPISGSDATPTFRPVDKLDVKAALAAALDAGTGITITDNGDGTFTFDASGGGGGGDAYLGNDQTFTERNTFTKEMATSTRNFSNATIAIRNDGNVTGKSLLAVTIGTSILGGIEWNTNSGKQTFGAYDGYDFGSNANATTMWTNIILRVHHSELRSYIDHQFSANVILSVVGGGLKIKEGTDATSGIATLVGGTVVVATTKVTADSRIQLTGQNLGTITVPVGYCVSARTPATSFTILSANIVDTSDVAWMIIEPA